MLSIRKPGVHRTQSGIRDGDCSDGAGSRCLGYWLDGTGPEKAKEVVRREGLAVYMITKEGDNFKTWMSPQFKSFLISEKN